MRNRHPDSNFVEDIRASQRNTLWPDLLVNSRNVDKFLWKGSPNPTLVQTIAACLFGLTFFIAGIATLRFARQEGLPVVIIGVGALLLGVRVFLNGFPKRKPGIGGSKDLSPVESSPHLDPGHLFSARRNAVRAKKIHLKR
jgi:hypothetical protein